MKEMTIDQYIEFVGNEANWTKPNLIELFQKHPNSTHFMLYGCYGYPKSVYIQTDDPNIQIEAIKVMRPKDV